MCRISLPGKASVPLDVCKWFLRPPDRRRSPSLRGREPFGKREYNLDPRRARAFGQKSEKYKHEIFGLTLYPSRLGILIVEYNHRIKPTLPTALARAWNGLNNVALSLAL